MKIVIDIPDNVYKCIKRGEIVWRHGTRSRQQILNAFLQVLANAVNDGTPLSKGYTNGDMIKAMFDVELIDDFYKSIGIKLDNSNYVQFNKDWWNAPYKAESEE